MDILRRDTLMHASVDANPPLIQRSWQRCLGMGLTAHRPATQDLLPTAELRLRQENHRLMRKIALREIELLQRTVEGTGRILLLASPDGVVLDCKGDETFLGQARRVCLQPGALWNEGQVGTNAIGTALIERRLVRIVGRQHFLEENRFLVCNAIPVMCPMGDVGGVLDLSGDARNSQTASSLFVRDAAAHIEHEWAMQCPGHDLLVQFHFHPSWLKTAEEGVLAFQDHSLIGATPRALKMMGLSQDAIGQLRWSDLFLGGVQPGRQDLHLNNGGGMVYAVITLNRKSMRNSKETRPTQNISARASEEHSAVWDETTHAQMEKAKRAYRSRIPVLLQGETGTGKEIFVQTLHREASPPGAPLVAVNCGAIPDGLLGAELFGYEEGAFTGARKQGSVGHIRRAHGGTLFLDEIGDMPLALQVKLLRVLQDGEVTSLGSGRPQNVSFNLVVASNKNLHDAVEAGGFREDLYYRLCHLLIELPPLRMRSNLPEILDSMLEKVGAMERGIHLSAEARSTLLNYRWPGNLREMYNAVHTLTMLAEDWSTIHTEVLPAAIRNSVDDSTLRLKELTSDALDRALSRNSGNVSAAARQLGIHRSTLYRRQQHRKNSLEL